MRQGDVNSVQIEVLSQDHTVNATFVMFLYAAMRKKPFLKNSIFCKKFLLPDVMMWKHRSQSMWLIVVLSYNWVAVLKDSCLSRHTWSCGLFGVAFAREVRGCWFKSGRSHCLTLVSEQQAMYYNYIYSRRDSFPESPNTFDHLLA